MTKLFADVSFWNNNHPLLALYEEVIKLVPDEGEVPEARKNRALEKLRRACNCYYDLFNNGLCNRSAEFRRVFGLSKSDLMWKVRGYWDYRPTPNYEVLEQKMAEFVVAAAKEQGVSVEGVQQ